VVVIGGAAGGSAASQVKRAKGDDVDVVMVERGGWTSYSACGIPYWVAGDVNSPEALVARNPETHRDNGIDVRVGTEAISLDLDRAVVAVRGPGLAACWRAHIIGREGEAKSVDVCAMALWTDMTVHELMQTDLSYAPPFSPVWDPVQVAARVLSGKLRHIPREEVS
jgi:hypothetical protein